MGEPAIPGVDARAQAVDLMTSILSAIRNDEDELSHKAIPMPLREAVWLLASTLQWCIDNRGSDELARWLAQCPQTQGDESGPVCVQCHPEVRVDDAQNVVLCAMHALASAASAR
jgi:hypothetical protein